MTTTSRINMPRFDGNRRVDANRRRERPKAIAEIHYRPCSKFVPVKRRARTPFSLFPGTFVYFIRATIYRVMFRAAMGMGASMPSFPNYLPAYATPRPKRHSVLGRLSLRLYGRSFRERLDTHGSVHHVGGHMSERWSILIVNACAIGYNRYNLESYIVYSTRSGNWLGFISRVNWAFPKFEFRLRFQFYYDELFVRCPNYPNRRIV